MVIFLLMVSLTMARPKLGQENSELTRREVIKELLDLMTRGERACVAREDCKGPRKPCETSDECEDWLSCVKMRNTRMEETELMCLIP